MPTNVVLEPIVMRQKVNSSRFGGYKTADAAGKQSYASGYDLRNVIHHSDANQHIRNHCCLEESSVRQDQKRARLDLAQLHIGLILNTNT